MFVINKSKDKEIQGLSIYITSYVCNKHANVGQALQMNLKFSRKRKILYNILSSN